MKMTPQASAGFAQAAWVVYGTSHRGALAIQRDDHADAGTRTLRVHSTQFHPADNRYRDMPVVLGGPVRLRVGESGARIAPEPIDTRKKKESRATVDRTLSAMQCPTLSAFIRRRPAGKIRVNTCHSGWTLALVGPNC